MSQLQHIRTTKCDTCTHSTNCAQTKHIKKHDFLFWQFLRLKKCCKKQKHFRLEMQDCVNLCNNISAPILLWFFPLSHDREISLFSCAGLKCVLIVQKSQGPESSGWYPAAVYTMQMNKTALFSNTTNKCSPCTSFCLCNCPASYCKDWYFPI